MSISTWKQKRLQRKNLRAEYKALYRGILHSLVSEPETWNFNFCVLERRDLNVEIYVGIGPSFPSMYAKFMTTSTRFELPPTGWMYCKLWRASHRLAKYQYQMESHTACRKAMHVLNRNPK